MNPTPPVPPLDRPLPPDFEAALRSLVSAASVMRDAIITQGGNPPRPLTASESVQVALAMCVADRWQEWLARRTAPERN